MALMLSKESALETNQMLTSVAYEFEFLLMNITKLAFSQLRLYWRARLILVNWTYVIKGLRKTNQVLGHLHGNALRLIKNFLLIFL